MEWMWWLLGAVVCFAIGANVPATKKQHSSAVPMRRSGAPEGMLSQEDDPDMAMQVPPVWDEAWITRQLTQLRADRPSLIPHLFNSIQERFVLRQDDRTAATRLLFLERMIEQLNLAKDYQQLLNDISLLRLERDKRAKTLELEAEKIEIEMRKITDLEKLEAKRDQRKIELEIAQLDHQINALKQPAAKASPEEQHQQRRSKAEAEYQRCRKDKQEWLSKALNGRRFDELSPEEQDHYKADENMWDERIQRAREEMAKHL